MANEKKGVVDITTGVEVIDARLLYNTAIYAQLSSSVDQTFGSTGTAQSITFNVNDDISGITHSTTVSPENITIDTAGKYSFFIQPQVAAAAGAAGYYHMWVQSDTGSGFSDIANSNAELILSSLDEDVIPLNSILDLAIGNIVRFRASVGHTGIRLDSQTPSSEPVIPSVILSVFLIGT